MSRAKTSQDVGLEAGLVLSRFFFQTEHLHYGYWAGNLDVKIENLRQAQEAYCDFLVAHIPDTARAVLDVGSGTGALAHRLITGGLEVDCVSPSRFLAEQASHRFNGSGRVFECRFEDFQADKKYDLVLFSESFQYLDLPQTMAKLPEIMTENGSVLICDFFRKDVPGTSRIGGGHRFSKFHAAAADSAFKIVHDEDITNHTAPTMDLANDVCVNVMSPIWKTMGEFLDSRYPRTMRMVRWKFRKKLEKNESKYFQGVRTGEHFSQFKTYRLVMMRLADIATC